jgi:hypothetical protein
MLCSVGGVVQWTRAAVVVVVVVIIQSNNQGARTSFPATSANSMASQNSSTTHVKPRKRQSMEVKNGKREVERERGRQEDKLRSLSAFPSAAGPFLASLGDHPVEPFAPLDLQQQWGWRWVRDQSKKRRSRQNSLDGRGGEGRWRRDEVAEGVSGLAVGGAMGRTSLGKEERIGGEEGGAGGEERGGE